ncbi:MAG: ABC transporter substrate-binding protein [Solirubrobacteraceae bacterium]
MNPLIVDDGGGICMLSQTGEFLALHNSLTLQLQPMLATSWKPSKAGAVSTFRLRSGVKFHNGQPLTADDVVYTFQQLADPKNASNALSTFAGVLKPEGVVKVGSGTVVFHLETANGNFHISSRPTTTTRSSFPRARISPSGARRWSAPPR